MGGRLEASSLDFGRRHFGFLEPEVTIFGRDGSAVLSHWNSYETHIVVEPKTTV